jgi:hypothetical protein
VRNIVFVILISALSLAGGCGGGGSSSTSSGSTGGTGGGGTTPGGTSTAGGNTIVTSGNNVAPLIVDAGPVPALPTSNVPYTTVVVCVPGKTNCVTIDHVSVDTGSTGLRIPATAFPLFTNGATVLAALQNVNPSAPVAECVQFLDNTFFWGTVKSADVKMGGSSNTGELASSVPIHVVGDPSAPTVPVDCTGTEEDTVSTLGENGRIGVGNFQYDCDALGFTNGCTASSTAPPGVYYTCTGSTCSDSPVPAVPLNEQVRNPVSLFATDNNGVIFELPAVPIGGQTGIAAGQGSMVFGIGTQSNNGLGSAVVLTLDSNPNDPAWSGFTTVYNGVSYPNAAENTTLLANGSYTFGSFLDSGSNGFFFLDQPQSGIPNCGDWYCPSAAETLTAVNEATGGNSHGVQFSISNANTLFNTNFTAFSDLAGPNTTGTPNSVTQAEDGYFDWGLPFFYGRNVYTAIWNVTPPSGVPAGPFWAY